MYWIHGLLIESEIPLEAGETAEGDAARAPDYRIVAADPQEVPHAPPAGRLLGEMQAGGLAYWAVEDPDDPNRWTIGYADVCEATLDRGRRRITVRPAPRADPGLISIVVSGSVLAHALSAEGRLVLHASAVEVGEWALAITGQAAAGKSTLAALLLSAGARLVADDALRVDPAPDGAVCFPSSRSLRLRPEAASLAAEIAGADVGPTADGRTAVFPPCTSKRRLKLGAVLLPRAGHDSPELRLERLRGAERLLELLKSPRLTDWRAPEPVRQLFELTSRLADPPAVYRAWIPFGPPFPSDLARALLSVGERSAQ